MSINTTTLTIENDYSTLQGLKCPLSIYKKFPHKLAVAAMSVHSSSHPCLSNLTRAAKGILAFLIRIADRKNPTKPSWAFKNTMAQEIGISESTVYRGLKELEQTNLIERLDQTRKTHNGRLAVSKISLTSQLCQTIGLLS